MDNLKFKKGDWCFCEFKLQQIMKTEINRITNVSDGTFNHGGYDLSDRCFPLEMIIKKISDHVAYWDDKFHSLKNNALNHPDLNRELISRWVEMCENKDNENKIKELSEKLITFGNVVIKKVNDLSYEEVDGVKLFRQ